MAYKLLDMAQARWRRLDGAHVLPPRDIPARSSPWGSCSQVLGRQGEYVMSEFGTGAVAFACVFGGTLGGMVIRAALPEHHRTKDTEDAVKLGMGVIATMGALVVGLLLASAKSSFDTKDSEIRLFSADLILLDRSLVRYGPETKEAREVLRRFTVFMIDSTWLEEASQAVDANGWMLLEDVQERVRALARANDAQRWLQARAL